MLDHLRHKASSIISSATRVTLSTYGPAGVQAGNFPCEATGLRLYLLIPGTSEILFNIENQPLVIATAGEWQLSGRATIQGASTARANSELRLRELAEAEWSEMVEIQPARLQILPADPAQPHETIDFPEINLE